MKKLNLVIEEVKEDRTNERRIKIERMKDIAGVIIKMNGNTILNLWEDGSYKIYKEYLKQLGFNPIHEEVKGNE